MEPQLFLIFYGIVSIIINVFIMIILNKKIKSEKNRFLVFIVATILTFVLHYSNIVYDLIVNKKFIVQDNHLLPVYPCNVIMWLYLVLSLIKDKKCYAFRLISEFVAIGGTICGLFGIFMNYDYLFYPSFKYYSTFKGLLSHNFMVFATMWLVGGGYVKISALRNLISNTFGVILFLILGVWVNLISDSLNVSNPVNAMYLRYPPFSEIPWANGVTMGILGLIVLFIILSLIELFIYDKSDRWYRNINRRFLFKNDQ